MDERQGSHDHHSFLCAWTENCMRFKTWTSSSEEEYPRLGTHGKILVLTTRRKMPELNSPLLKKIENDTMTTLESGHDTGSDDPYLN